LTATDGRRARGQRRRAEVIEATLRVIERDGVAGVTHRTVAREASLPTTSSTYYFAGLDDLLVAALTAAGDAMVAETTARLGKVSRAHAADEFAALLAEYLGPRRGRALAEYELYLFAARRPELRPAARRWLDSLAGLLRPRLGDEIRVRAFLAALDGLLIQGLIAAEPPTEAELRPLVRQLLNGR
jgi:DNA-binding transcriptional regulator YbjK